MTPSAQGRRRVLLVEDDPDVREALAEALMGAGLDVAVARNGEHALRSLMDSPEGPRVIVLDMTMPVMDGLGFLERLDALAVKNAVRVVILSAAPVPAAAREHATVTTVLQKPTNVELLVRAILRAFDRG